MHTNAAAPAAPPAVPDASPEKLALTSCQKRTASKNKRRADVLNRILLRLAPPPPVEHLTSAHAPIGAVLASLRGRPSASAKPRPEVSIAWMELPPSLHMMHNASRKGRPRKKRASDAVRVERKQRQCDAFAAAIAALCLPDGAVVVDFGSGSCGLTLPLAFARPAVHCATLRYAISDK